MMWYLKSKTTFSLIILIAVAMLLLMSGYLFHISFNRGLTDQLFQYCFNIIKESFMGEFIVGSILNLWISFTVLYVVWKVIIQIDLTNRLKRKINRLKNTPLSTRFQTEYALKRNIAVIENAKPLAFTMGLFHPRVIISTGLLALLDEHEVRAVVFHELYHQRHFDPLKVFIASLAADTIWYIPVIRELVNAYKTYKEFLADRYVIRKMGSSLALSSALLKLIKHGLPAQHFVNTVPFADSAIDLRIKQLLDPSAPIKATRMIKAQPVMISIVMFSFLTIMVMCGYA